MWRSHITVKVKFPIDFLTSRDQEGKYVLSPVRSHFFLFSFFFPKPLFCVADRKALRGNACKSAVTQPPRAAAFFIWLPIDRL